MATGAVWCTGFDLHNDSHRRAGPTKHEVAGLLCEVTAEEVAPESQRSIAVGCLHAQPNDGHGGWWICGLRGRVGLGMVPLTMVEVVVARFDELDDDAQGALRMEERLLPVLVRVIDADDAEAELFGLGDGFLERLDLEVDVVDAGAELFEVAMDEAAGRAVRLDDLDSAASFEVPMPPRKSPLGPPKPLLPPSSPTMNSGASVILCVAIATWSKMVAI